MPKTIHLAGLGVAGMGMYRCLRESYHVQGHDASPWAEQLAHDEGVITEPEAEEMWHTDMILPTPDALVHKYAGGGKMEGEVSSLCFLPDLKQIELCQDKAKTAEVLGDLAPKTYWVRDTHGAGGKGAQMASEFLPGRNVSYDMLIVRPGKSTPVLRGGFVKERLSYSLKKSDTDVRSSGSSAVSVCIWDQEAINKGWQAVAKIAQATGTVQEGFYGVDFKADADGELKVTEINAGRLLTASYVYFAQTGYNLALSGVKIFLDEPYEPGDYPLGWGILRTMDRPPLLCSPEETATWRKMG